MSLFSAGELAFHLMLALMAFAGLHTLGLRRWRSVLGPVGAVKLAQEALVVAVMAATGRELEHPGETLAWLAFGALAVAIAVIPFPVRREQ